MCDKVFTLYFFSLFVRVSLCPYACLFLSVCSFGEQLRRLVRLRSAGEQRSELTAEFSEHVCAGMQCTDDGSMCCLVLEPTEPCLHAQIGSGGELVC